MDFQKTIEKAIKERVDFIARNETALIEAWIAQHGFNPDEMQVVRQDLPDGTIRMWVERRGEFAALQRARALIGSWDDSEEAIKCATELTEALR